MISRRSIHFAPAGVLLALWLAVVPTSAQDSGLIALVDKSLAAMNEEKWQESLDLNSDAVSRFGKDEIGTAFPLQTPESSRDLRRSLQRRSRSAGSSRSLTLLIEIVVSW